MGRFPFTARRAIVTIVATFVASLVVSVAGAGAIVRQRHAAPWPASSLLPSLRDNPLPAGVSAVDSADPVHRPVAVRATSAARRCRAARRPLLSRRPVMHKNEVFALTWDQHRSYWARRAATSSSSCATSPTPAASLSSPYAVTTQYNDGGGQAQNASSFGGGCIDYGAAGGSACEFGSPTGAGHDFPASGCPAEG